jgi:hypothetical protein
MNKIMDMSKDYELLTSQEPAPPKLGATQVVLFAPVHTEFVGQAVQVPRAVSVSLSTGQEKA